MSTAKTRRYIARRLSEAGLEPHAVAGILGNIEAESSFNPKITNSSSGAYGLVQWLGDRRSGLQAYARSKGKSAGNLDVQIDYIIKEIKSGRQSGRTGTVTIESLNRLGGPGEVAEFFDTNYERSEGTTIPERRAAAKRYYGMAKKQPGKSTSGDSSRTYTWVPGMTDVGYNQFKKPNSNYAAGYHTGNDISAKMGAKIIWAPPVDGEVISRGTSGDYGNHMVIRDEEGREWLFAHMNTSPLKVGKKVSQGEQIGEVGSSGTSTGAHLHIEQTVPGKGTWSYDSNLLKNPKLKFKSKSDYGGGTLTESGRTEKGYYGIIGDYSKSYLDAPGNEELKRIYQQAKENGWNQQKIQNEIRKSEWYKRRSESQREFDRLGGADQQALLREKVATVKRLALETGVVLSRDEVRNEAMRLARDGDTDDQAMLWLSKRYEYDPEASSTGFVRQFQEDLTDLSRQYGYSVGDAQMQSWTREAIGAGLGADSYEDEMRASAEQRFPELNLNGRTLADALSPWMDTAAQELGIQVSEIDLMKPKWTDVINPDTGKMYTNDEWRKRVRTDFRYGWRSTQNGQREMSQAAGILGQLFGAARNG